MPDFLCMSNSVHTSVKWPCFPRQVRGPAMMSSGWLHAAWFVWIASKCAPSGDAVDPAAVHEAGAALCKPQICRSFSNFFGASSVCLRICSCPDLNRLPPGGLDGSVRHPFLGLCRRSPGRCRGGARSQWHQRRHGAGAGRPPGRSCVCGPCRRPWPWQPQYRRAGAP